MLWDLIAVTWSDFCSMQVLNFIGMSQVISSWRTPPKELGKFKDENFKHKILPF